MGVKLVSAQRNLLLDLGNTSIKYAWYTATQHIADLQVMRTTVDSLSDLLVDAHVCYICSVRKNEALKQIVSICDEYGVACVQVHTEAEQFGVHNAYSKPSNMGTDRWMAILAGGALSQRNYLVVDAGTAITCDFVVSGKHLGGWIAPGLQMARHSVVQNTQRVFDDNAMHFNLGAGTDTPECVAYGALAQLTGMLTQAKQLMYQYDSGFDIYISGGDGATLISACDQMHEDMLRTKKQHLDATNEKKYKKELIFPNSLGTTNYVENIVLVGLARVAEEKCLTIG